MWTRRLLSTVLPLLAACSSASPPPVHVELPPVPVGKPNVDPAAITIAVVPAPAGLAIDGDPTEWGSLLPKPRVSGEAVAPPDELRRPGDGEPSDLPPPPRPATNPAQAPSHLAVALTNEGLFAAGDLAESARDGIWFGVATRPPRLPHVGHFTRGGYVIPLDCEYEEIYVGEGGWSRGERHPPDVAAACKALYARYDAALATHRARFARLFKIDASGVHAAGIDGTLSEIAGARFASRATAHGHTVELALPLAALPRMVEAPVEWLRLVAAPGTTPKPPEAWGAALEAGPRAPDPWMWAHLSNPVSFEPWGDMRARAFAAVGLRAFFPPGLSYRPSEPLVVESAGYAENHPDHLALSTTPLYEKLATMGDVDVGYVTAFVRSLAILKAGKLVDVVALDVDADGGGATVDQRHQATPKGFVARDGVLYVLSFARAEFTPSIGFVLPAWSVIAVAADGTHRQLPLGEAGSGIYPWMDDVEFASKDFETIGIRATTTTLEHDAPVPIRLEVTWRWDKAKKAYIRAERRIALPRKSATK